MNTVFKEVPANFGFGMMRLPMKGNTVDFDECNKMVDAFMGAGLTYFDTAKGYLSGQSEVALRECVVKRYPRESFTVTDKLSEGFFQKKEDIRGLFEEQLRTCGVSYFDFYLMHAQNRRNYEKYKRCEAYEVAAKLKAEGKIRHIGLSFHDSASVLEQILSDHPELELVQLQVNYLDFDDPGVQSRKCLEVCKKHSKPVVVMEPVKGGALVNLPAVAQRIVDGLGGGNNASYALRFAAGCDGVFMVLSGMSNMTQMADNLNSMIPFVSLKKTETEALFQAGRVIRGEELIACTACRYCVDGCPKHIPIPDVFADMNARERGEGAMIDSYRAHTANTGKPGECIACGRCEAICPQHLDVRRFVRQVAIAFGNE